MKACARCSVPQPPAEFYRAAKAATGLTSWCRSCYRENYQETRVARLARKKVLREADIEASRAKEREVGKRSYAKNRERIVGKRYGLSAEQYAEMVARSRGRCEICGEPPSAKGLCVDHDHATGVVRGLLCTNCNHILGKAGDDQQVLRAAITYLDYHQERFLSSSPHEHGEQPIIKCNPTGKVGE